jgi:processive 1,2-diacylglycerol beta-glucosyltransferase
MIKVYNNATGERIGEITDTELQFLIDQLEEESLEDKDYYLNRATLEILEKAGGDPAMMKVLWKALGDDEGVEIRWSRR